MPVVRIFEMRLIPASAMILLLAPATAVAQDIKPLLDARLRFEQVDQDGFGHDANAVTLRLRAGVELSLDDFKLLAEGEGTVALGERYDSGLNGKFRFPLVGDPENIELNRLQLQYRGLPKTLLTLGRQRINLDDQRFVGSAGWRQNEQTFDALRLEIGDPKKLRADLTYAWSVRSIWGVDGKGARQQSIGGNNVFATISHPTVLGTLSGFAFMVDQDEARVQGYRLSSQTYGLRLAGSRPLSRTAKLTYVLSYAHQSDFHRNPNDYRANYWLAEAGVELGGAKFALGHERLGSARGTPLTSFQTPLATLHKFQGWADKFTVTPPDGLRDTYATAGYSWKKTAGLDVISTGLTWHRFESDRRNRHYGDEWNAVVSAKRARWTATAKVAAYGADGFVTDTSKLWLQLEWAY